MDSMEITRRNNAEIISAGTSSSTTREGNDIVDVSNSKIRVKTGGSAVIAHTVINKESFPVNIPYHFQVRKTVRNFCGRDEELEKIHRILRETSMDILSQSVAISGLGGIGKTETAKAYALKYKDEYDIILFIIGDDETSLTKEFHQIADIFKVDKKYEDVDDDGKFKTILKPLRQIVSELYELFSSYKTLIIIDNIEEQQHITKYLPNHAINTPKFIITSRKQFWKLGDFGVIMTIHLDVFPLMISIEFIIKSVNVKCYLEGDPERLAKCLSNFPLALKQATSEIEKENKTRKEGYTIAIYLNEFESNKKRFLKYKDRLGMYKFTLITTWSITVDKLETKYGKVGIRAFKILKIMAYIHPDNIDIINFYEQDSTLNMEAISLLHDYSMIDIKERNIFIHRLVQEVTRINTKEKNEEEAILEELLKLLNKYYKDFLSDFLTRNVRSIWKFASCYPNILKNYYYKGIYNPLIEILVAGGELNDIKTVTTMLEYEYNKKRYDNIVKSLIFSLRCGNAKIVEKIYDSILDRTKCKIDINSMFKELIRVSNDKGIYDFFMSKGCNINYIFDGVHTPLMLACMERNNNFVTYLLKERKCRVNYKNALKQNALMIACEVKKNDEIIKTLIESGKINLNNRDREGKTVLMYACKYQNADIISILVNSKGIDINLSDNDGVTALMYICQFGTVKIAEILINKEECDLNNQDSQGLTAFAYACHYGKMDIVSLLIKNRKTDIVLCDKEGRTPLGHALLKSRAHIAKMLINTGKYPLNEKDKEGLTGLMLACRLGLMKIVKKSISNAECDINIKDVKGMTALMYASSGSSDKLVEILIKNSNTDLALRDNRGLTALSHACGSNRINICKILISTNKYNLNESDCEGCTTFMHMCRFGLSEIVRNALSKDDCDVNKQDVEGLTALMQACIHDKGDIVDILIKDPRVNLTLRDKHERTALTHARLNDHMNIFKILVNTCKYPLDEIYEDNITAFMYACRIGCFEAVKNAIEKGECDINAQNKLGLTALMYSCKYEINKGKEYGIYKVEAEVVKLLQNQAAMVKLLIENVETDVNMKDFYERTALMHACLKGKDKVVKTLIENSRIDVNVQDYKGYTALIHACELNLDDIAKILLKRSECDVNIQNEYGLTGLMYSCFRGNDKLLETLIKDKRTDFLLKDNMGFTALFHASGYRLKKFQLLLNTGKFDLNEMDNQGHTILMGATMNDRQDVVRILMENDGCDINTQNDDGMTAFMYACRRGNLEIIKLFVENANINLNLRNKQEQTAFLYTCKCGNIKVLNYFLDNCKFNMNDLDNEGKTALHLLALSKSTHSDLKNIVTSLIMHGCDIGRKDKNLKTPLDYSYEVDFKEGIEIFKKFEEENPVKMTN